MNSICEISESAFRSDRTLHVVLCSLENKKLVFYLFNYEGIHIRVFDDLSEMIFFFNGQTSYFVDFGNEDEVDEYMKNVDLVNYIPMNCAASGVERKQSPYG